MEWVSVGPSTGERAHWAGMERAAVGVKPCAVRSLASHVTTAAVPLLAALRSVDPFVAQRRIRHVDGVSDARATRRSVLAERPEPCAQPDDRSLIRSPSRVSLLCLSSSHRNYAVDHFFPEFKMWEQFVCSNCSHILNSGVHLRPQLRLRAGRAGQLAPDRGAHLARQRDG